MRPSVAADPTSVAPAYSRGFGNEHHSEAIAGALPVGQNSPQQVPFGLFAEQLSGTSFTVPRSLNRRSWLYRIRPSAKHLPFRRIDNGLLRGAPIDEFQTTPKRLRWGPLGMPAKPVDFIDGLVTMVASGNAATPAGFAAHIYAASASMVDRYFSNADGELLIVPYRGRLRMHTEFGIVEIAPGEIGVIQRGIKFRVELADDAACGYVCENYGALFNLPELGPIGANGLANPRDFLTPVAAFEDRDASVEVVVKFMGNLWSAKYDHSPLDVVAWHGNYAPYKYDTAHFNAVNTVSFDHIETSVFTVLTSASGIAGMANVDFVIFPPRWLVAEHTFRPPWFHRNFMSEFMGLISGQYDAKAEGFVPGGASLHNCMSAHGPDALSFERARTAELVPEYLGGTLAFMFEGRFVCRPTRFAMECPALQRGYDECWDDLPRLFPR